MPGYREKQGQAVLNENGHRNKYNQFSFGHKIGFLLKPGIIMDICVKHIFKMPSQCPAIGIEINGFAF